MENIKQLEDKIKKISNIAYNAIVLGELDSQYTIDKLAYELGCKREDIVEIIKGE